MLKPQTWRIFSSTHVNHALPTDPERRKKLDERNELRRFRLAHDPEYQAKQDEDKKQRRLRYASDPQYRKKQPESGHIWNTRKSQDPEYVEARNASKRSRYESDIEFRRARQRSVEKSRVRLQAENPRYRLRKSLHQWCLKHDWVRETLPWKTHQPVLFASKVHKECKGCTRVKVREGVKLWWRKIGDRDESWLCHACHMPMDNHTAAMPYGYEDVTTLEGIINRKQELERTAKG